MRCSTMTGHVVKLDLHNDIFKEDVSSEDQQDLLSSEDHLARLPCVLVLLASYFFLNPTSPI